MSVSYRTVRAWQRNWDVFLQTWPSQIAFTIIEPLIVLVAMGYGLGTYVQLSGEQTYVQFLAPGLVAAYAMWSSAAECSWGTYIRMDQQRTFDAMIVTPLSIEDVISGEVLWGATRAIETTVALLLVMLVFQITLSPPALLVLPAMFLQGLLFGAAGVTVAAVVRSIGELNHFASLFLIPQYMFAGVFFPMAGLPDWAVTIGWFMPLFHGASLARSLVSGNVTVSVLGDLVWLLVVGAVFFALGLRLMRRRLIT